MLETVCPPFIFEIKKRLIVCKAKWRKYRRIFEEHSRQVRKKDWSQQVKHMQIQKGRDQVSGGVSIRCRHATPVANFLWKPLKIR